MVFEVLRLHYIYIYLIMLVFLTISMGNKMNVFPINDNLCFFFLFHCKIFLEKHFQHFIVFVIL